MKKIMIIDGGPRKGMNTAQMVDYKDAHWEQDLQKSRKAGKRMAEEIYEKIQ